MKINWDPVYAALEEGDMPECLGASCPESCCRAKKTSTRDGEEEYRTSFAPEGEYAYHLQRFGPVEATGANTLSIDKFEEPTIVVQNCTSSEDPRCKLEARRPFICRLAPFGLFPTEPVMRNCPAIAEIAGNEKIVQRVLKAREAIGLKDNARWLARLRQSIEQIKLFRKS